MTKDEAFEEYEEALDRIDRDSQKARGEAKAILQFQLKSIRAISQKTKEIDYGV